jgi:hypothetical protein
MSLIVVLNYVYANDLFGVIRNFIISFMFI